MRTAVQQQFQYRAATYIYMFGMVAEPVIYLVVWTTIAEQRAAPSGPHGGLLRRLLHRLDARSQHEHRVRRAVLGVPHPRGSALGPAAAAAPSAPLRHRLVRRLEGRLGSCSGCRSRSRSRLLFDPTLDPRPLEIAVFAVAIWGAYLIRTMFQSALGMLCFWTTRGAAIFNLYMTLELLLSGRLVPLPLMPDWVENARAVPPLPVGVLLPDRGARRRPVERGACSVAWVHSCSGS